jgi:hypothetical protein
MDQFALRASIKELEPEIAIPCRYRGVERLSEEYPLIQ